MRRRKRWGYWPEYVSVAERKAEAEAIIAKLRKKGEKLNPISVGRTIAGTFWGKAWCKNLESYSDFANRLPRGRSYVRNGLVVDLNIAPGEIQGLVSGSSLYKVLVTINPLSTEKWQDIIQECSGKIDSLLELLQGKFSKNVMEIITRPEQGLFPNPKEIKLSCSCPDYANMCKHVAAVLYAIGARLDTDPESLFVLRKVDHTQLITSVGATDALIGGDTADVLGATDLSTLFGIDIEQVKTKRKLKKIKKAVDPKKTKKKLSKKHK